MLAVAAVICIDLIVFIYLRKQALNTYSHFSRLIFKFFLTIIITKLNFDFLIETEPILFPAVTCLCNLRVKVYAGSLTLRRLEECYYLTTAVASIFQID